MDDDQGQQANYIVEYEDGECPHYLHVERTTKPSCMQLTETNSGSLVRRAGARAAVGHLDHHHSDGELAATPRRTSAARTQKSVVITTNLFSARHRHRYGPRRAGVSRRAAYACGLSACTRPSRARMKSAEKNPGIVAPPHQQQATARVVRVLKFELRSA